MDPRKTAVVLIEFQNDFTSEGGALHGAVSGTMESTGMLDNAKKVAGAAREHPGILVIGLLLSVALMGLAANFIARIINRYRWIAYIGLAVIVFVAGKMIYEGWAGTAETAGIISLF